MERGACVSRFHAEREMKDLPAPDAVGVLSDTAPAKLEMYQLGG